MQFKTQLLFAATAVAAATPNKVEPREVHVVHILEKLHVAGPANVNYSPNKRDVQALFARADLDDCQDMATDLIKGMPTAGSNLDDWAESVNNAATTSDPCSLYAPASLSEELMDYMTDYIDWLVDIQDDAAEFVEECSQFGSGQVIESCESVGTIFFTENNETETVRLEEVIASATAAADDDDNAAPGRTVGLTAAIAAAVGAVGVVIAL
ncbi:hypothetical protein QQZ08_007523 [Neonectria magnoliae]|uniref:Infection structure specific protein n=1 Tax=Neonectria magnoliae TaxID=2732573 RepID=A0ABR1HZB3_9HYPO